MLTLLSISMRLPAICGELLADEAEPPTTTPAPPQRRKKRVRFSLHDEVYIFKVTDGGTLEIDSLCCLETRSFVQ